MNQIKKILATTKEMYNPYKNRISKTKKRKSGSIEKPTIYNNIAHRVNIVV